MKKDREISEILDAHYSQKFAEHGDRAAAMDWRDQNEQYLRFRSLLRALSSRVFEPGFSGFEKPASILDVGCGTGHFYDFLRAVQRTDSFQYSGTDINSAMIATARGKFPEIEFSADDFLTRKEPRVYDHVFTNGILTLKTPGVSDEDFWIFAGKLIDRMWQSSSRSMAFNMITKHVKWEMDTLFHVDPKQIIEFIENRFDADVSIFHDYNLFEFVVLAERRK